MASRANRLKPRCVGRDPISIGSWEALIVVEVRRAVSVRAVAFVNSETREIVSGISKPPSGGAGKGAFGLVDALDAADACLVEEAERVPGHEFAVLFGGHQQERERPHGVRFAA